jgi:hypothetical protein
MGALVRSLSAAFVISLSVCTAAQAVDRPIDGQRLVLKKVGAGTKLTFVSRDPAFLFPAIGGADDPATVGATVELFSQSEGQASLDMPAGVGNPGWNAASGSPSSHRFRNGDAPGGISAVRVAVLREGKVLKIVAKDAGLPLAGVQGAVGIRITTGTLRSCARFAGSAIRRDLPGIFVGSNSNLGDLSSCSDGVMSGQPECGEFGYPFCGGTCPANTTCVAGTGACHCVSLDATPCGETSPVCGGTCPAGEQCAAVGPEPAFKQCVCLPTGSTPCGDPGAPVCGGACPSGTACKPVRSLPIFGGGLGCSCNPPGPCGKGGADCPNGFACSPMNPQAICAPIECFGTATTYPTCGGTCVSGALCQPLKTDSGFTTCLCALPAPCDAACGGYTCATGEVCTAQVSPSLSCSCGAP